eukprot:CAMPEP_0113330456 /NCGR_PEP_ID=MMETSP0010_2-20120614/21655_1 /TAXON_ID=216773 ORGANISM="Corethron hystrix, Strain 308" /NCGR_SAMPLE_ID=MMETSP0010_2 /ASSEMBLY_ACC=CAM_ASM_000155 /LENGTH=600 /DNA_ID=CAMNT_0000193037 /DNA_START=124 /DNA_END=1924 /DNA_ORIENTATION=+ /assembly_acc=CAM_ASM_000155
MTTAMESALKSPISVTDCTETSSEKRSRKEKKEALKAEAVVLGISYEELKTQKKKEKKAKKKSEVEDLLEGVHDVAEDKRREKRMRSYSHDVDDPTHRENQRQKTDSSVLTDARIGRVRTRSMDKAEDAPDPAAWMSANDIVVHPPSFTPPAPYLTFKDAPFGPTIMQTIEKAGYTTPTCIQSMAWPIVLGGRDFVGIAKTGSGKTASFLLPPSTPSSKNTAAECPLNDRADAWPDADGAPDALVAAAATSADLPPPLPRRTSPPPPAILVLAPTRELACQIAEEAEKFGRPAGVRATCLYGGAPKGLQIRRLEGGVECIIATPGRLNDILEMKKCDLSRVEFLVLDEADRMLDMGFEPQIRSVVEHIPKERRTMMFSATWPKEIRRLAQDFLTDQVQVNVGEVDALVANKDVTQIVHLMNNEEEKMDKLKSILDELSEGGTKKESHGRAIVFVARKMSCDALANEMWELGYAVDSLHGDRQQWERTKVINAFKSGNLRMLVATDVAARGLDVKGVELVVNYDMPAGQNGVEDYVHRIGRTGRAGAKGLAHAFFTRSDSKRARELVEVLQKAGQVIPDWLASMGRPRGRFGGGGYGGRGG